MRFDLPSWIARIQNSGNKLPAGRINNIQERPRTRRIRSAQSTLLPIHYGRNRADGRDYIVTPFDDGAGNTVYAVAWGWQEYEEIEVVYIDDQASTSYAGVTVTNHLGTNTQAPDPTLVAGVTGYNDSLHGVVYSVISIPNGTIDNAPRFACALKGRKVYDPRSDQTVYTTNPGLCLADMISNTAYGEGKTVVGVEDVANFCDELVDGLKRCEIGIEISNPRRTRDYSLLLAEYAEAFIIEEGDDVRIRPDKAETAQKTLTDDDFEQLDISVGSTTNAPTVVELRYTLPQVGSGSWPEPVVTRQFPGVGFDVQRIESSVKFDGVFREEEANRKAESRLRRGQLSSTYDFVGYDAEVLTQVGDVILLDSQRYKTSQLIRITGVQLIDSGRYRIQASRYDDYAYPDSVTPPTSAGQIFDGFIVPLLSGNTPSGWTEYNTANSRYLMGSEGISGIGDTGGNSQIGFNGSTSVSGLHTGSTVFRTRLSSQPDVIQTYPVDAQTPADGAHSHTFGDSNVEVEPYTRESKLVVRSSGATSFIPNNCGVFSNGDINSPDVDQVTSFVGRVFKAAADWANTGSQSSLHGIMTAPAGAHDHGASGNTTIPSTPGNNFDYRKAPNHQHVLNLTLTPNMLRHRLYLYSGAEDFTVQPGMIVATESTDSFAGWLDCDGNNDTPPLNSKYIEIASAANIDTTEGNNTVTITGVTDTRGPHNHLGGQLSGGSDPFENVLANHDDNAGDHNHTCSTSASYNAPFIKLRFLMYTGT